MAHDSELQGRLDKMAEIIECHIDEVEDGAVVSELQADLRTLLDEVNHLTRRNV